MKIGVQFKEIYIHLVENAPEFVCTIRYGGLIGKSKHFLLEIPREIPPHLEEESFPVVRSNRRRDS